MRKQTTHVICIYMYNTNEGRVQRSITWMSFDNHIIIRKHYAIPILSDCYFILAKSLLCHCYFYLLIITPKIKFIKVNYSIIKQKLNKACIKSVALKSAVLVLNTRQFKTTNNETFEDRNKINFDIFISVALFNPPHTSILTNDLINVKIE